MMNETCTGLPNGNGRNKVMTMALAGIAAFGLTAAEPKPDCESKAEPAVRTEKAAVETIPADKVTSRVIQRILSERFTASLDEDGDACVVNGGMKYYVYRDTKNDYLTITWRMTTTTLKEEDKAAVCKEFNNHKIFVRFIINEKGVIVADYNMSFAGGLNVVNLQDTVDWFCIIVDEFWKELQKRRPPEK